ncbi:response regulator [Roseimicrobium sp. ORNL1]|uniref:response regulator transcription factor n=1 Tax=Roseimicrobium sp. ORNL1 TaxID=2711231 RepID=UPI0013E1AC81|nr:response regulator [Roseimicrobium sp. ORNL1]QIF06128.1 response regulator transcription factor [Roseimicrobium sp. ORNL1]
MEKPATATIGLVDDDEGMLRALGRLLRTHGYATRAFDSPDRFLMEHTHEDLNCVVLDVSMPGCNGLELQEYLNRSGKPLPIIFLSGEGNIPISVRAMKAGAVTFLVKPVEEHVLLESITTALEQNDSNQSERKELDSLRRRMERLTAREREVLEHVISGKPNKLIAADLGLSIQTVKVHRMQVTKKLEIPSVAGLVSAANRLGVVPAA